MLAGGLLYLDSYRDRLIEQRREEMQAQAEIAALALAVSRAEPERLLPAISAVTGARVLLFGSDGSLRYDSWKATGPTLELRDPAQAPLRRKIAARIDRVIDWLTGAGRPMPYDAARPLVRSAWPEAEAARHEHAGITAIRAGPDESLIISAAARVGPLGPNGEAATRPVLHLTADARDITYSVRDERLNGFLVFLGALGLSLLLSTWLARTIVTPLRRLAIAARRVRLGRAREVTVPRLPARRDEIGQLARAVSDMTGALRQRIDATEAFAADVAHELKNPLASLRSALETFAAIDDPALQKELIGVMTDDVARLDRLVTDIADASRLDAEISRARFTRVDLGAMVSAVVRSAAERSDVALAYEPPPAGVAVVMGSELRLGQVVRNLLDNAISFSPTGARVDIRVERLSRARVYLVVEDRGPGVPPENREDIFKRFYSARPEAEPFGKHSGLGLAIARAVVEAHDGTIAVEDREGGGARFTVSLPAP